MSFDRFGIYTADLGGIGLYDLTSSGVRYGKRMSAVIPGGDLHPRAIVLSHSDPTLTFETKALERVLGGSPLVHIQNGYAVDVNADEPTDPVLLQFQRRADGSSFVGPSVATNVVGSSGKGFAYVEELSAQQDDESGAKLSLAYMPLSIDGLTDPIAYDDTSTLLLVPSYDEIFYLGPVKFGQAGGELTPLPSVQSVSIKTGIDYRAKRGDGEVFAQRGTIHAIVPEIRVRLLDVTAVSSLLAFPFAKSFVEPTFSINCYFLKGVHGSSRWNADTNNHVRVTAANGEFSPDDMTVSQLDDVTTELVIRPIGGISVAVGQTVD